MIRRSVIQSSEHAPREINYSLLTLREIQKRIRVYEKKYGAPFAKYNKQFSCHDALPWEMTDIMDWEYLVQEKNAKERRNARHKKTLAYRKP